MEFTHAINRYMLKSKTEQGLTEAATEVSLARKELHESNLASACLINEITLKRKASVYHTTLQYLDSRLAMAEREAEQLRQIRQHLEELRSKTFISPEAMETAKTEALKRKAEIQQRCTEAYNPLSGIDTNSASPCMFTCSEPKSPLEPERAGYLYKRSSHSFRPIWGRRYFILKGDKLIYHSLGGKVKQCCCHVVVYVVLYLTHCRVNRAKSVLTCGFATSSQLMIRKEAFVLI